MCPLCSKFRSCLPSDILNGRLGVRLDGSPPEASKSVGASTSRFPSKESRNVCTGRDNTWSWGTVGSRAEWSRVLGETNLLFQDIGQRGIFSGPLVLGVLRWASVFKKQDEKLDVRTKTHPADRTAGIEPFERARIAGKLVQEDPTVPPTPAEYGESDNPDRMIKREDGLRILRLREYQTRPTIRTLGNLN